jgi:hypothetical protein
MNPKMIKHRSKIKLDVLKMLSFDNIRESVTNSRRLNVISIMKRMGLNVKGTIDMDKPQKLDRKLIVDFPSSPLEYW